MSAHSVLAPSSAGRIVQCPGSVTMGQAYPEAGDSPDAMDGVAAHWACSEMLEGRLVEVGQQAPNGVFLTEEMVEAADLYFDDVATTLAAHGLKTTDAAIEAAVSIPAVHELCWGTPDARAWVPGRTLYLWDFKFGHRIVDVFENWQLIAYVSGCLSGVNLNDQEVTVVARIVQPRAYHRDGPIREWRFNGADIRAHVNILRNAAHQALAPNPQTRVGPYCRDCTARHACVTLQRAALSACDVAGDAQPFDLPTAAMGTELRYLKRAAAILDARISGLEEQALARAKRGELVPGWRVAQGLGRERWKQPATEVIAVAGMLGVNVAKPPAALTPKQAVKAGLDASVVAAMSETPRGEVTLVEDDGSRARSIFGRLPR